MKTIIKIISTGGLLCLVGLLSIWKTQAVEASDRVPLDAYTQDVITVNVTAMDGISGVRVIEAPDGNHYLYGSYTQGASSAKLSYVLTQNGDYTFTAVDVARNRQSATKSVRNIDKDGPAISINGNPTEWTNESIMLDYEVTDDISGVNYVILPDGTLHAPNNLFVNSAFQYDIDALYDVYGWDWTTPSGSGEEWTPVGTNIALFRNREALIELIKDDTLNTALRATSTGQNWETRNAWGVNMELTTGGMGSVLDYVDETAGTRHLNMQVWLRSSERATFNMREGAGGGTRASQDVVVDTNWELYTLDIPEFEGQSIGVWQDEGVHYHGQPTEGLELFLAYPIVVPGDSPPLQTLTGQYMVHQNDTYTFRSVDRAGNVTRHEEIVSFIDKLTPSKNRIDVNSD